MTKPYSRQNKQRQTKSLKPSKHIKTGFTALQKTLALIGSILSIIVASITINNALNANKSKMPTNESSTTVIQPNQAGTDTTNQAPLTNPQESSATEEQTEEPATSSSAESSSYSTTDPNPQTSQIETTTATTETDKLAD